MQNISSALISLWNNKVRSLLTLLGVIIGVSSVTILVSLGQGLKNDVANLVQGFGTNVLVVVAGNIDTQNGSAVQQNPANFISGDILTPTDVSAVQKLSGIDAITPIAVVPGALSRNGKLSYPTIMGVYPDAPKAFEVLKIGKGQMFTSEQIDSIVLAAKTAKELFGDTDPLGQKVLLGDRELTVVGVFGEPKSASIFGSEFATTSAVPFDLATALNDNRPQIMRIVINADDKADVAKLKKQVNEVMLQHHDNKQDFSVLSQDDLLGLLDQFLTMATALVSAIAAISLVVGGIGIMNIMLVTVTERTREIGLRKAVGATKLDILGQFLTEAVVLTLLGGLIGLGIAYIAGRIVAANTPLQPYITPQVIGLALGISSLVGLIFGLWPAIRAANKTPIEALRYE